MSWTAASTGGWAIAAVPINPAPGTQFTINASAGPNGSISPSGTVDVPQGYNQSFTMIPNGGYKVSDVLVDGGSIGAQSNYQFPNVQANHTIEASFEEIPEGDAITYLGDIGTNTTKTDGTSLTVTTNQAVPAGNLIIVGYATDPAGSLVVTVTDNVGNTYQQAALAVNLANGRAYIFYAFAQNPLPSSRHYYHYW